MSDFASNPTFVDLPPGAEAYEGEATKVAMTEAQRANGFIPEQPIAAEHLNAELAAITSNVETLLARDASDVSYDPAELGDWNPNPDNVAEALDGLAARTAAAVVYTPAVPGNWAAPDPTRVAEALDRLAALGAPAGYARVRDDFMPGATDSATHLVHADRTWRAFTDGAPDASTTALSMSSSFTNPGVLTASVAVGQEYTLKLAELITAGLVRWGELEAATLVFGMFSSNYTGAEVFVGLGTDLNGPGLGADAVGLWFKKSTSNNWMVRHKHGGAEDATTTALVVVNSKFVVMAIERAGSTQVKVTLNGTLVATLTDGTNAPADVSMLNLGIYAAAGSATLGLSWDLVDVLWKTPSRQTP